MPVTHSPEVAIKNLPWAQLPNPTPQEKQPLEGSSVGTAGNHRFVCLALCKHIHVAALLCSVNILLQVGKSIKPGMVLDSCKPSIWGGRGRPGLQSEFQESQGYTKKPLLNPTPQIMMMMMMMSKWDQTQQLTYLFSYFYSTGDWTPRGFVLILITALPFRYAPGPFKLTLLRQGLTELDSIAVNLWFSCPILPRSCEYRHT